MPVSSRPFAVFALTALLAPALARADYTDDYVDGLAALDHGQYERAVQALKKALAAQSESQTPIRIEGVSQPYLPHHFLGIALVKLGDCAAAKAEWDDPANARSLGRLRQLRAQEEQLGAACKPAEAAKTPPSASAAQQMAPASTPTPPQTAAAAPTGPPPALTQAYADFVAGRYARTARLDVDAAADARVRFQSYLLRSAARYALSRSGDTSQLALARSDARAAQALDQSAPDARVFSPAFRAFYSASH